MYSATQCMSLLVEHVCHLINKSTVYLSSACGYYFFNPIFFPSLNTDCVCTFCSIFILFFFIWVIYYYIVAQNHQSYCLNMKQ